MNSEILHQLSPWKFYDMPVSAGFPSPAADYMEEQIDLDKYLRPRPSSTFLIRVKGDSMCDACIPDGAMLVVDRSVKPVNGRVVLAVLNGELVLKRFIQNMRGVTLMPANKKYASIQVTEDMDFRVWGTVTHIIVNAATV